MDLAPRFLEITMLSVEDLKFKAHDVFLSATLAGDANNKRQSTPVCKKGSTSIWLNPTFIFLVRDVDACVEFKLMKKKTLGFKKVVGGVDVRVMDLVALVVDQLANGCVGDMMKPKVLSCEVRSSSPKTKEETIAVLEFSFKFGELLSVEETVEVFPAAAGPSESYGPSMPHRPPMASQHNAAPAGYGAAAPADLGRNLLARVAAEFAANEMTGMFNDLGFDVGNFPMPDFDM